MYVIFAMRIADESQLRSIAGLDRLLGEIEQANMTWSFLPLGHPVAPEPGADDAAPAEPDGKTSEEKSANPAEQERRQGICNEIARRTVAVRREDMVFVTDSPLLAGRLSAEGLCVFGVQRAGAETYFDGAAIVIQSFEGIGAHYLKEQAARFHGKGLVLMRTRRLLIRESIEKDFDALYSFAREAGPYAVSGGVSDDEESERERFNAYISAVYKFFGFGLWTVEKADTGEVIGRCGLAPVTDERSPEGRIELGYMIGKRYRRRGYASEACEGIIHFATRRLECQQLYVSIRNENVISAHFARRLGFRRVRNSADEAGASELWMREEIGVQRRA